MIEEIKAEKPTEQEPGKESPAALCSAPPVAIEIGGHVYVHRGEIIRFCEFLDSEICTLERQLQRNDDGQPGADNQGKERWLGNIEGKINARSVIKDLLVSKVSFWKQCVSPNAEPTHPADDR